MTAYLVATETVKDEPMFAKYRQEIMATLAPFDAKFIVRGGALSVLEGEWPHPRLVVIEFPSRAAVETWYRSDAYQKNHRVTAEQYCWKFGHRGRPSLRRRFNRSKTWLALPEKGPTGGYARD